MMLQKISKQLITGSLRVNQLQAVRTCYPYHHQLQVISRPHVKGLSFPEKIFWGLFIAGTIVSVPAWVLVHLPEYRGETSK